MYRNLVLKTKQLEYKYPDRECRAFTTTLQSPGPDVLVGAVLPLSTVPPQTRGSPSRHVACKWSDRSGGGVCV
jgi:hypothetical protein